MTGLWDAHRTLTARGGCRRTSGLRASPTPPPAPSPSSPLSHLCTPGCGPGPSLGVTSPAALTRTRGSRLFRAGKNQGRERGAGCPGLWEARPAWGPGCPLSAMGSHFSAGLGQDRQQQRCAPGPWGPQRGQPAPALRVAFRVEPPLPVCLSDPPSACPSACTESPRGAKLCARSQVLSPPWLPPVPCPLPWPASPLRVPDCGCSSLCAATALPPTPLPPPCGPACPVSFPGLPLQASPGPPPPLLLLGQQGPWPVGSGETGGPCGRPVGCHPGGRGPGWVCRARERRDGVFHAGPRLIPVPVASGPANDTAWPPPAGRAAPSSLSSPGAPLSAGGKGRGLPIVPEQQPHVAGAPVIDEAWKLVPEFN